MTNQLNGSCHAGDELREERVRRGARLPRELITVVTVSDGSGNGKMFDSLECHVMIFQSSASGPVL